MTTYGDFSSLLQLGVGIGIGLTLFRAPVDVRVSNLQRLLDGQINALKGAITPFGKEKRKELMHLRYRFAVLRPTLERRQFPFMVCAVLGAIANLCFLVLATVDKDKTVSEAELTLLLFVSIGLFSLLLLGLEILARFALGAILKEFEAIQVRRETSVEVA